jgi:hypothetical protein
MTEWIDDVINGWASDPANDPGVCEQRGCREWAQTWCPLCERYLCTYHDELLVERRHDCLGGRADV